MNPVIPSRIKQFNLNINSRGKVSHVEVKSKFQKGLTG